MTAAQEHYESSFFFLPGKRGQLFAALRSPANQQDCKGAVLCVMPLAEEMNRCRRLVAVQSCALARIGVAVLCIDSFGCGDSEGEFAEADWQTWVDDLRLAREWLEEKTGHEAGVWAIRHGALLAAAAFEDSAPARVVLWQPVVSGAAALSEMLRVSVASSMLSGSERPRTVNTLRTAVLGGETIEVGGYPVTANIARALEAASLDPWPFTGSTVDWIYMVPEGSDTAAEQHAPGADAPDAPGAKIRKYPVAGRRFWSSPDVFESHQLVGETLRLFGAEASS